MTREGHEIAMESLSEILNQVQRIKTIMPHMNQQEQDIFYRPYQIFYDAGKLMIHTLKQFKVE